jgi:transposase
VKKPKLSLRNIADRKIFAGMYGNWDAERWDSVLFSDESSIKLFSVNTAMVRRPAGQRFNPRYTVPRVGHPPSLMVWGAINRNGAGPIHILPQNTNMNGAVYRNVLEQLLPDARMKYNATTFMQDGAPCHQCANVMNWLEFEEFHVLAPWPGNSPDLNPIENVWSVLKRKVHAKRPNSIRELEVAIRQVWENDITPDLCRRIIDTMPRRLAEVIRMKGAAIRY